MRELTLNRLDDALERLDYPLTAEAAASALDDVRLLYADGSEPLTDVLERTPVDRFESAADLRDELLTYVSVEAVGEPGQAEGEG